MDSSDISNQFIEECLPFDNIPLCKNVVAEGCNYLNELTTDNWKKLLEEDDDWNYELIEIIGDRNKLPRNCFTAFNILSLEKLKENKTVKFEKAEHIINKAIRDKLGIKAFAGKLKEEYLQYGTRINIPQFCLYAQLMFQYGNLESDERSLGIIFRADVISEDACKEIIFKNKQHVLKIYEAADKANQEQFRDLMPELFEPKNQEPQDN